MLRPFIRHKAFWSRKIWQNKLQSRPIFWLRIDHAAPELFSVRSERQRYHSAAKQDVSERAQQDGGYKDVYRSNEQVYSQSTGGHHHGLGSEEDLDPRRDVVDSEREGVVGNHNLLKAHEAVMLAVRHGEPAEILSELLAALEESAYMSIIPPALAVGIIECMDFEKLMEPYEEINLYSMNTFTGTASLPYAPSEVATNLTRLIMHCVQKTTFSKTLPAAKLLLRAAHAAGDATLARDLMYRIMTNWNLEPDIECFNLLMRTLCWDNKHDPVERSSYRVTERSKLFRSNRAYTNYGFQGYRIGSQGLYTEVTNLFIKLQNLGMEPDLKSFESLVTALGREGDLAGVAAVLGRVWDVKPEEIMALNSDEIFFENELAPDSPLYPTKDTLFTIVHVYASNNQLSTALRLLDYVSRKFSLQIGLETWIELMTWTLRLSTRRRTFASTPKARERAEKLSAGKLPHDAVENLYQVMTSEPYNVEPSLKIHDARIRSLHRRNMLTEMIEAIVEADKSCSLDRFDQRGYSDTVRAMASDDEISSLRWPSNPELMLRFVQGRLLERWVKLFLGKSKGWHNVDDLEYQRVALPNIIGEFGRWWFSTRGMSYSVESGHVQFHRSVSLRPHNAMASVSQFEIDYWQKDTQVPVNAVLHLKKTMGAPFREPHRFNEQEDHMDNLISKGSHPPKIVTYVRPWFLSPEVGNWIWMPDGTGTRSTSEESVITLYSSQSRTNASRFFDRDGMN